MWSIQSLTVEGDPSAKAYVSDGQPIGAQRGPAGSSYRIGIPSRGYFDVTDTGHQPGGPHYWQLVFNGKVYWYDGEGAPVVVVGANSSLTITGDGNDLASQLQPFASINHSDIAVLQAMKSASLIPYPEVPKDGRPFSSVAGLAPQYFGFTLWQKELALSVYDWTTADFFRMDLLRLYRYTALADTPLDVDGSSTGSGRPIGRPTNHLRPPSWPRC